MKLRKRIQRAVRNRVRFYHAARDARARMPGLITRVARRDDMMVRARPDQYFIAGQAALEAVERALAAARVPTPTTILDLPSGYGRVLRYFRARWPDAEVTASELVPEAVEFCARTFGVKGLVSRDPLWDADLGGPYDLVWCGSLFTHFDAHSWAPSLAHLRRVLAPGGILVFTTQGQRSLAFLSGSREYPVLNQLLPRNYGLPQDRADAIVREVRERGFGFAHYAGAEADPYGVSLALPGWVSDQVRAAELHVVHFEDGGWGGHQDVWTAVAAR